MLQTIIQLQPHRERDRCGGGNAQDLTRRGICLIATAAGNLVPLTYLIHFVPLTSLMHRAAGLPMLHTQQPLHSARCAFCGGWPSTPPASRSSPGRSRLMTRAGLPATTV